jgi:hypothetical protein
MLGLTIISEKRLENILVENANLEKRNEEIERDLKVKNGLCRKLFEANCKLTKRRDEKGRFIKSVDNE